MTKKILSIVLLITMVAGSFVSCGTNAKDDDFSDYLYHYHSYGEWEVSVEAGCKTDGTRMRSCSCGETQSETIFSRNYHNFGYWVTVQEKTCTANGKEERVCYDCGEKEANILLAAHDYKNGVCDLCNRALINVILPSTPITVYDYTYNGAIDETCKITSIKLKSIEQHYDGSYSIDFVWAGEKTYDDDGNNYSSSVGFGYKLYDSDGYVVYDSNVYSVAVSVGEKFKDQEFGPSFEEFDSNETYTLKIFNLD